MSMHYQPPPFQLGIGRPMDPRLAPQQLNNALATPITFPVMMPCLDGALRIHVWYQGQRGNLRIGDAAILVPETGYGGRSHAWWGTTVVVPPGTYSVIVQKNFYLPDSGAIVQNIQVAPFATVDVHIELSPTLYHLHVDTDRDGVVDDDRSRSAAWVWGPHGRGAILVNNVNNDDGDGAAGAADNTDTVINANRDTDHIAPVEVRREGGMFATVGWTMQLYVDANMERRARVFDGQAAGAPEIIGPNQGRGATPANLDFNQWPLAMEAIGFPTHGFNGIVTLRLHLEKPAPPPLLGRVSYEESVVVRTAPWLMFNHHDTAQRVYTKDLGNTNQFFRQDLLAGLTVPLTQVTGYGTDRWLQDCMEFGYTLGAMHRLDAVLELPRGRPLQAFPGSLLSDVQGVQPVGNPLNANTFNSGGNLECTPPCKAPDHHYPRIVGYRDEPRGRLKRPRRVPIRRWVTTPGRPYPHGRIYYCRGRHGEWMDPALVDLLDNQGVQPPILLDASWLGVGHVDEMLSFVPMAGNALQQFALVIASPRRAYEILGQLDRTGHHAAPMLVHRQLELYDPNVGGYRDRDVETTVRDFLRNGIPYVGDGNTLMYWNRNVCQGHLDGVLRDLRRKIDIPRVIEAPVLFLRERRHDTHYHALTGDTANMLVVGGRCLAPIPYGPEVDFGGGTEDVFERVLRIDLQAIGADCRFVSDWYPYHDAHGEVHCGTNTRRTPHPHTRPWYEHLP